MDNNSLLASDISEDDEVSAKTYSDDELAGKNV